MHDRRVNRELQRLHAARPGDAPGPEHRQQLESRLLAAYRQRNPRHRRWLMLLNPWNRTARFAMMGLSVALLGVAACSTSTVTEVEMGQKMTIEMDGKVGQDFGPVESRVHELLAAVPGVEKVLFGVHEEIGQAPRLAVAVWGRALDPDQLGSTLRREVPELAGAKFVFEPLAGSIEESIASRLGRDILHLELDVGRADEVRAQILEQLHEQGIGGDAHVEIHQAEDGTATIDVTVEQIETEADGDGEKELHIELKHEGD